MPSQETIEETDIGGDGPLAVDLRSVVEVRDLRIMKPKLAKSHCLWYSFFAPKLHETRADISIDGEVKRYLNLRSPKSPLPYITKTKPNTSGCSARLSSLRSFNTIVVNSRSNFDCDALTTELEENSGYPEDGPSLTCGYVQSSGLSKLAKILVEFWVPLEVALLVSVAILIRKEQREAFKISQGTELIEMLSATPPTPSLPSMREESNPRPVTGPSDIFLMNRHRCTRDKPSEV
ncbi:hypothetical protein BDV11DRAFT_169296 [Aspergillus similis]